MALYRNSNGSNKLFSLSGLINIPTKCATDVYFYDLPAGTAIYMKRPYGINCYMQLKDASNSKKLIEIYPSGETTYTLTEQKSIIIHVGISSSDGSLSSMTCDYTITWP